MSIVRTNGSSISLRRQKVGARVAPKPSINVYIITTIGLISFVFIIGKIATDFSLATQARLSALIIFAILIGLWLSTRLAAHGDVRFACRLFLTAFAVRLLIGFVLGIYLLATQGSALFQSDAVLFHDQAISLVDRGGPWYLKAKELALFTGPSLVYAVVYAFLGDNNPFLSLMVNVFLSALTPVLVWRVAQEAGITKQVAHRAAWLMTFLPVTVIYSSTHVKEGPVTFAVIFLFYLMITSQHRQSWLTAIIALPFLLLVLLYRDRLVWPLLFLFFTGMGVVNKKGPFMVISLMGWLLVACGLAFLFKSFRQSEQNIVEWVLMNDWWVANQPAKSILSPLAIMSGSGVNPLRLLAFVPVGTLYALIIPLPFFVLAKDMYFQLHLLSLANTAWLMLLPLFLMGCILLRKRSNRWQKAFVLLSIGGTLMMAFSLGAMATFGRHREIFIPFMLIVTAAGWEYFRSWEFTKKIGIFAITLLFFNTMGALYLWNKGLLRLQVLILVGLIPCFIFMWKVLFSRRV